ncbi:MAG TPA: Type II secretory pathway, pullulanase PulA, partial [Aliiroseovarius sp.]|nr:Type II secretory pathway, pullulanase PulA [Aliiroseovarius sp.]
LALEARAMKDDLMLGDTPKARTRRRKLAGVKASGRLWKHSILADIHGLVQDDEIADFFTFTLVRNPWDRVVSYYHWLRAQSFDHPAVRAARGGDFPAFLRDGHVALSLHEHPYPSYMTDRHGTERADAYLRLEHLEEDIAPLEAHLGFALTPLPHANRSARARDYREYYSDADAELLGRICADDIARFGYRFG